MNKLDDFKNFLSKCCGYTLKDGDINTILKFYEELQQENQQLKEQLKQRDEDIIFCLKSIDQERKLSTDSRTRREMTSCYEILRKYKGDNNE